MGQTILTYHQELWNILGKEGKYQIYGDLEVKRFFCQLQRCSTSHNFTYEPKLFCRNRKYFPQSCRFSLQSTNFLQTRTFLFNLATFFCKWHRLYKPQLFSTICIFSTSTTFLLSAIFYNFVWILWLKFGALVEYFTAKLWWATAKLKLTKVTNLNLKSPFYRVNGLLFQSTVGGECEGRKLGDMKCCRLEG